MVKPDVPDDPSVPSGEDQGIAATFSIAELATAFGVEPGRVAAAAEGELGMSDADSFVSTAAQQLAEVLLADRPLAERQAALMELGAFTPRPDAAWGLGDTAPGEESDRLAASPDTPDDDLASKRSSYDPATQDAR